MDKQDSELKDNANTQAFEFFQLVGNLNSPPTFHRLLRRHTCRTFTAAFIALKVRRVSVPCFGLGLEQLL